MKYDRSKIFRDAWKLFRKLSISFGEALHRAWNKAKARPINDSRVETARAEAGITESVNTWAGWRESGFEVIHGSKALFQVDLIHASKGDGVIYKASFFSASQVQQIVA